ncbi:PucR family transcriptional regulator [Nonomuraea sp. GTA35]|uniref:PucR family transcriptional regulator n=1 Tax=Nonomuraea sp. GTA35 TaxID=1676746 RepID=UPI0035C02AFC
MAIPELPADLLKGHWQRLADHAATGRLPDREALDAYRAAGARAAELGLPLRALVDAALAAGEDLPGVLPVLRKAVSALMEGYEAAQLAAIRSEESARREFVDDLLQGRAERLAERAEHFGLRLAESYVVTVARGLRDDRQARADRGLDRGDRGVDQGDRGLDREARDAGRVGRDPGGRIEHDRDRIERDLITRFGSHNVLVAVRDGLLVCVAPATLPAAVGEFTHHVRARFPPGWRVGVGRAHRGPGGVVASYREAAQALELADGLRLKIDVVKAADLLVFPVLLRDRSAIEDLVHSVLSPLLEARGGHEPLLETLEAIFASHGNQTAAARRLGVSPRAVTYRLERIRRLTGFSPDDPTQRFTLETAVLGARLLGWPAHG